MSRSDALSTLYLAKRALSLSQPQCSRLQSGDNSSTQIRGPSAEVAETMPILGKQRVLDTGSQCRPSKAVGSFHLTRFPASHFLKVCIVPLCFEEKTSARTCFLANLKKSEEDFHFYDKGRKAKIGFSVRFAAAMTEAACTPSSKSGPAKFLPREPHSASQH